MTDEELEMLLDRIQSVLYATSVVITRLEYLAEKLKDVERPGWREI